MADTLTTAKLSANEGIKSRSNFLRGGILDGLSVPQTGAIADDDTQLTKFHGIYQQDDRDLRAERGRTRMEPAYSFMARLRIPGGQLTPAQWLAIDEVSRERGDKTVRLTTRETVQFHGILKGNLRPALHALHAALLDSIAACGDVNRNVMATVNPHAGPAHAAALQLAHDLSDGLLPKSRAWHEIWVGEEQVVGPEEEPMYGATYLPRKFKIAIAVPPRNDVDMFAHDVGFAARIGADGTVEGWDVTVGGGMGMTHGDEETFPRTADWFAFVMPEQAVPLAAAILTAQRDHGNRAVRKNARLKYTIERMGLEAFRADVQARLTFPLAPVRPAAFTGTGDQLGWYQAGGLHHFGLWIENGRIHDTGDPPGAERAAGHCAGAWRQFHPDREPEPVDRRGDGSRRGRGAAGRAWARSAAIAPAAGRDRLRGAADLRPRAGGKRALHAGAADGHRGGDGPGRACG